MLDFHLLPVSSKPAIHCSVIRALGPESLRLHAALSAKGAQCPRARDPLPFQVPESLPRAPPSSGAPSVAQPPSPSRLGLGPGPPCTPEGAAAPASHTSLHIYIHIYPAMPRSFSVPSPSQPLATPICPLCVSDSNLSLLELLCGVYLLIGP